ncbi:MAG: hypothetical protein PHW82_09400 [Bacteroidales bacterium]|nr:hypothetical protein [Bacteroidales bacterium]
MKKATYILKDLSIRKMPGFPRGLKSLNDFASNINIITGVNASGKSSVSRVIQQLIWHDNTKGLDVKASVSLDKDLWGIHIDSDKIIVQRNGNQDQISGLPTAESKHRYLLALHKLVEGKENDLAKEIAKQSIGGFDLDAVQTSLEYSSKPYNRSISEYKAVADAEKNYKNIWDEQKKLKAEEDKLDDLYLKKENSENAAKLNEFYSKIADYLELKSEYAQLSEQMKEFSNAMRNLSGKEYEQIQELESQIEDCQSNIENALREINNSKKELEKLTILTDGIGEDLINEIEKRLEQLSELERNISNYKTEIEGLKSVELNSLNSIDKSINPEEWKDLNIDDVSGLDKMLKDAHQVLGEKEYLLSEIEILEKDAEKYNSYNQNPETFTQGIKTLGEWLKEPINIDDKNSGLSFKLLLIISLVGVFTAIVTFFAGWPGLLGIVLIVFILAFVYLKKDKSANSLDIREQDFINSGLNAPLSWDVENVANRIDELIENLRDIKNADSVGQRLNIAKNNLNRLQERMDNLNKQRKEWIDKLQTAPGLPENYSNDFSSLYWFLINLKKWQDAYFQRKSLDAKKSELENQKTEELDKINALFQKSNLKTVTDASQGKAVFKDLRTQESTRKTQVQIIEQKNEQITVQNNLKTKYEQKLADIYLFLDIKDQNKDQVLGLVNNLENYRQINDNYRLKQLDFASKERLLKEHSLYEKYQNKIEDLSVDQAKEEANNNKETANQLEEIQKEITSIETLIKQKKKGHELEDVLTKKEAALDNLNRLYESNLYLAAGDLIINKLKKETQNQNRPIVFKRANEILNKITNGRYELLLGEEGEPKFKAYDTVLQLGQDLSELSTGTRVQLLLSVRLAYVETAESAIKLPLLADELLANSDDERAKAIIESLVEISREGRQVFYFTAQADEVGKWLSYLQKQSELKYQVIQLDGGTNKSNDYSDFMPDLDKFNLLQSVPAPKGKTHKEYGDLIHKLSFNVLIQNGSELHLWYLIDNPDLLYACLKKGIKTWGQLESYFKNNGQIQGFNKEKRTCLMNKIEILNQFQIYYRQGRSLPIDRSVLKSSDAISDAFIDRVAEKLGEANHNPKQLLKALRNGEVSRFRADNADDLENYLMTEGYIDDQKRLEIDEIIIRMNALISRFEIKIQEVEDFINRILSC